MGQISITQTVKFFVLDQPIRDQVFINLEMLLWLSISKVLIKVGYACVHVIVCMCGWAYALYCVKKIDKRMDKKKAKMSFADARFWLPSIKNLLDRDRALARGCRSQRFGQAGNVRLVGVQV